MNKPTNKNFITNIIDNDNNTNKFSGRVQTRFPPEPNGYLHIGHAKSIYLNFEISKSYNGKCNLRFDDTNPEKENVEFIESIKKDIEWLGYQWDEMHFASDYFNNLDKFALGICNGCQTLSNLKSIIPGSENWPSFIQNKSERFESRITMVAVEKSNSIFLTDMNGSKLPIVISHGEGRANLSENEYIKLHDNNKICMNYIDDYGSITENYPCNPNGSYKGIAGVSSSSGNVTLMMPHPERLMNIKQFPTRDSEIISPWSKFFYNARMHLK